MPKKLGLRGLTEHIQQYGRTVVLDLNRAGSKFIVPAHAHGEKPKNDVGR